MYAGCYWLYNYIANPYPTVPRTVFEERRLLDFGGRGQLASTIDIVLVSTFYKQTERCERSLTRKLLITRGIFMQYRHF